MTPCERTQAFISGQPTDRPPFHPIVMRWAARHAGVKYRDFCLDFTAKNRAMLHAAELLDCDWVTVMSDAYAEAQAFGLQVDYPEDSLPLERGGHLVSAQAGAALAPYKADEHPRLLNRINEIKGFKKLSGDTYFIVGWVEGPMAEYSDIRGLSEASMDLYDEPEAVAKAMDVIVDAAIPFITRQIEAGANAIGIGDAFASQIGPDLYREFVFAREKRLVDHIHSLGALAKLHICGNTAPLLPDMIKTGANILDVDHLVPSMAPFVPLLGPNQVFSGKVDPVSVVQNGTPESIRMAVKESLHQGGGRCIISAGCEVPPDAPLANVKAMRTAAE